MAREEQKSEVLNLFRNVTSIEDISLRTGLHEAIIIAIIRDDLTRLEQLTNPPDVRTLIFYEIEKERWRQDLKHPTFPADSRMAILVEEVGEVARALNEQTNLEEELIHVAATATRWLEIIVRERKQKKKPTGD